MVWPPDRLMICEPGEQVGQAVLWKGFCLKVTDYFTNVVYLFFIKLYSIPYVGDVLLTCLLISVYGNGYIS